MNGIHTAFTARLAADPETRFTGTGKQMLTFSAAVDENRPGGDGADASWIRVTCWDDLAEQLGATLKKGAECYIEGKLKLNTWTGKDGEQRASLNVSAWTCQPLGAIGKKAPKRVEPFAG